MDKVLVTLLLLVASAVASSIVVGTVMPAVHRAGSDIIGVGSEVSSRIRTDVRIIEVASSAGSDTVKVWVKNVGSVKIGNVDRTDVFFGEVGAFQRITYDPSSNCSDPALRTAPCWQYALENDTEWSPFATVRLTIYLTAGLQAGKDYTVKLVLPSGLSVETVFSL